MIRLSKNSKRNCLLCCKQYHNLLIKPVNCGAGEASLSSVCPHRGQQCHPTLQLFHVTFSKVYRRIQRQDTQSFGNLSRRQSFLYFGNRTPQHITTTLTATSSTRLDPSRTLWSGPIRFVSAKLSTGKITGRASFIRLSVREPKFGTYTPIPPSITLTKGQPSVSKKAFREAVLHFEDTGPYQVQVTSNITAPRTILLTLYGQDEDGVIFPGRKL